MIIKYDDLIKILMKHCSWGDDTSPREALYLDFRSSPERVKDSLIYHTKDESNLVIDVDEEGKVLGIEIV
ncbi:MAG: DUF2283 domain-containing protein [Acidobacteria bacterium]|nr:DUF2283 domain-containing protein [Acidobacteriota bacterium]MBI3658034.1 DUF2283 domain-containing protein [Acidobacteriota bacterium]